MELIKTYSGGKQLKHWRYDANDKKEFVKNFPKIDENLAERLCLYLREKNKLVDVIECYDGQSGWKGENFIVNGKDLSINGYCFSASNLDTFLISMGF